jgi:hypothetical protein
MKGITRMAGMICLVAALVFPWGACAHADSAPPAVPCPPGLVPDRDALIGYWPLCQDVRGTAGSPRLMTASTALDFVPGPLLGDDGGLDLRGVQYLMIEPDSRFDAESITVELFCKIQQPEDGCLFGIRNGNATRFSLHYAAGSPAVTLWDGSRLRNFAAPAPLEPGRWYHLALSVSAHDAKLWVDGQACGSTGKATMDEKATGLPFVVGTSDADMGEVERAEVAVADLAMYRGMACGESIQARLEALDWFAKRSAFTADPPVTEDMLDAMVAEIRQTYGVEVLYKYNPEQFIPAIWRSNMVGAQIALPDAKIHLEQIEKFLKRIPRPVLEEHLKAIYLFKTLSYANQPMGGMAYQKAIYLCYGGPRHADNALFHEFTHLLQTTHPPDAGAWAKDLPADFRYLGAESKENAYHSDDSMRSLGFVLKYAMTSLNEEMAVLSDYVFTRPRMTRALMKKHPAIQRRVERLIEYYKSISPDYDFSEYQDLLVQ